MAAALVSFYANSLDFQLARRPLKQTYERTYQTRVFWTMSFNELSEESHAFLEARKKESPIMLAKATACVALWQLMVKELEVTRMQFLPPTTARAKDMYNVFTHGIIMLERDINTWNTFHDTTMPVAEACDRMQSDIVGFTQRFEHAYKGVDSKECVLALTKFMNECMRLQEFNEAVMRATFDTSINQSQLSIS